MIRRTTVIVFIMLANILILAHAVVPHHHHHHQVCLVKSHCIDDNNAEEQSKNEDNHNHDGNTNTNDCILKVPVVVSTNQLKQEFKFINNTINPSGNDVFQNGLLNNGTETLIPVLANFVSVHIINCSYSSLVSVSLGLRAPPLV